MLNKYLFLLKTISLDSSGIVYPSTINLLVSFEGYEMLFLNVHICILLEKY